MKKVIDMVGRRFGRLIVIEEAGRKRKEVTWKCKCDCGAETVVTGYYLRSGHTQSCGCLIKDSKTIKHGLYGSRIHSIYYNMKNRCYNPNYYLFHRYGGRGIAVCDEWLGENGLQNFYEWSVENGYADKMSIDRIDNDKGYSPDNCRWVTMKQQQNNRSTNRIITVNGISRTLSQWADVLPVSYRTLQRHVKSGDIAPYIMRLFNGYVRA